MPIQTFTNRFYCDVFAFPTGPGLATVVNSGGDPTTWADVEIYQSGVLIKATTAPGPPMFLRAAANPAGEYLLVAQSNTTGALLIYDSALDTWTSSITTFGIRAVDVGWNGSAFIIIAVTGPTTYERITYGGSSVSRSMGMTNPLGLLSFVAGPSAAADNIRWTPTVSPVTYSWGILYLADLSGGVLFGTTNTGGGVAILPNGDRSRVTNVNCEDPRIAVQVDGSYAVCSWALGATQMYGTTPPWPQLTPGGGGGGGGQLPSPPIGGGIFAPGVKRDTALARTLERELPRLYHETDRIEDPHTQRMGRLLWDRTYDINDQIKAVDAKVEDYDARVLALEEELQRVRGLAEMGGAASGKLVANAPSGPPLGAPGSPQPPGSEPSGPGGTPSADLGNIQSGFLSAGPTGHVTPGSPANFTTAGMIIRGTANEFPALLAPTVDLPTREANALQLLQRIIWHLNLAGITAGRQKNPSGALSRDKMAIQIQGRTYAYDIYVDYDNFAAQLQMSVHQVFPANYQVDGGIAD